MKNMTAVCLAMLILLFTFTGVAPAEGDEVLWFAGDGEVYNSLGEHFCYLCWHKS